MTFKTWDALLRGKIKPKKSREQIERQRDKLRSEIDNMLSRKNVSKSRIIDNPPANMSKAEWRSICKRIGLLGGYTRRTEGEITSVR